MILKLPVEVHRFLIKYVLEQWGKDNVKFSDMDLLNPLRRKIVPVIETIAEMQAFVKATPFDPIKFVVQFTLLNNDSVDITYDFIGFSENIYKLEIVDSNGHYRERKIP